VAITPANTSPTRCRSSALRASVVALLLLAAAPSTAEAGDARQTQGDARAPFRVGGPILPPVKINDVKPVYPLLAQEARVQGTVILEVVVDATGHVVKASILRSIPLLDQAALDAVRQWEFRPVLLNGVAIPVVFTTVVTFSLAPGNESQRPPPPADALERAAALFGEARTLIQSATFDQASSSASAPWSRQYAQAGMLLELARRELKAFPDQAADDAEAAFGMLLSLPGGGPNVDLHPPPATAEKLARMGKMQGEPEAIRVLLAAGRVDIRGELGGYALDRERFARRRRAVERALGLARTADIDRSDLYDQIIREERAERALELADECRAADGTYPFAAVADVARTLQAGFPQHSSALLERAYSLVGGLRDEKSRSLAMLFIQKTHDMVSPAMALGALDRLVQDLPTAPPAASVDGRGEADILGPWILEVMNAVDPQSAAVLVVAHADWEAARTVRGRTPGNAVGRFPIGGIPRPPWPPGVPPAAPAARPGPSDFERDLLEARALPESSARAMRLVQLAESLLQ
jgi:TonB family protein